MPSWKSAVWVALVAVAATLFIRMYDNSSNSSRRIERLAKAQQLRDCREGGDDHDQDDDVITFNWRQYYHKDVDDVHDDNVDEQHPWLRIHPCSVFSNTYLQARRRFREAVAKLPANAFAQLVTIPIMTDDNDDNNVTLTIDLAILPGTNSKNHKNNHNNSQKKNRHQHRSKKKDWLIHSSGTHGIEGYAGSAIQLAYLQHRLELYTSLLTEQQTNESSSSSVQPPSFPNIVLIHTVNPFGMHHYRRVNENNVDLNRNALHHHHGYTEGGGWQQALSSVHRAWVMEAYNTLSSFFNPPQAPTMWFYDVQIWYHAAWALMRDGYSKIKGAMVAGQYHDPHGIFYGGGGNNSGTSLEPSLQQLWKVLRELDIVPSNEKEEDASTTSSSSSTPSSLSSTPYTYIPTLTWIDVHTGLGPPGQDTLLCSNRKDGPDERFLYQQHLKRVFAGSLVPLAATASPVSASSSPPTATTTKPAAAATTTTGTSSSQAAQQVVAGYQDAMGFVVDYVIDQWKQHYLHSQASTTTIPKDATTSNHNQKDGHNQNTTTTSTTKFLAFVQEFGTIPSILVARALIVEHMAWRFLSPQQHWQWAQFTTRAAFYPNVPSWRAKVLQNGLRVLLQAQARYEYNGYDDEDEYRGDDDGYKEENVGEKGNK